MLYYFQGSTRAFPPHHPLIPVDYQLTGQPVLIGGTMGTCSYVLTGTEQGMLETFGSTCHGAVSTIKSFVLFKILVISYLTLSPIMKPYYDEVLKIQSYKYCIFNSEKYRKNFKKKRSKYCPNKFGNKYNRM